LPLGVLEPYIVPGRRTRLTWGNSPKSRLAPGVAPWDLKTVYSSEQTDTVDLGILHQVAGCPLGCTRGFQNRI
jgi:hypothetical protein